MNNNAVQAVRHYGADFRLGKHPIMRLTELQLARKEPAVQYRPLLDTVQGGCYVFSIEASLDGLTAVGTSFSKKDAKKIAALILLQKMGFQVSENEWLFTEAETSGFVRQTQAPETAASQQSVLEEPSPEQRSLGNTVSRSQNASKRKSRSKSLSVHIGPDFGLGKDPISRLTELQMLRGEEPAVYRTVEQKLVNSTWMFTTEASLHKFTALGTGPTKKEAKRSASTALLHMMGFRVPENDLPVPQQQQVSPPEESLAMEVTYNSMREEQSGDLDSSDGHQSMRETPAPVNMVDVKISEELCVVPESAEAPETNITSEELSSQNDHSFQDNHDSAEFLCTGDFFNKFSSQLEESDKETVAEKPELSENSSSEGDLISEELHAVPELTEAASTNTTSKELSSEEGHGFLFNNFPGPEDSNKATAEDNTGSCEDSSPEGHQSLRETPAPVVKVKNSEELRVVTESAEAPETNIASEELIPQNDHSFQDKYECAEFPWMADIFNKFPSPAEESDEERVEEKQELSEESSSEDDQISKELHVVSESTEAPTSHTSEELSSEKGHSFRDNEEGAEYSWIDYLNKILSPVEESDKESREQKPKLSVDSTSEGDQISKELHVVPEPTEAPTSHTSEELSSEEEYRWIDDYLNKISSLVEESDEYRVENNTESSEDSCFEGHQSLRQTPAPVDVVVKMSEELTVVPESTEAPGTSSAPESLCDRTAESFVINTLVEKLLKKQPSHVRAHHNTLVDLLEKVAVDHFKLPEGMNLKPKNLHKLGKAAARDLVYEYGDAWKVLLTAQQTSTEFQEGAMKHLNIRLDSFKNRPKSGLRRFFHRWDKAY